MKKLTISLAIASALGLTACDDTTLEDVKQEVAQEQAQNTATAQAIASQIKVVWDPANSVLSIPNDLILSTSDFTLDTPAELVGKAAGSVDWSNPEAALGALDGWGLQNPFTIALEYPAIATVPTIDAATLAAGVAIYEVKAIPDFSDPLCLNTANAPQLCKAVGQLTYGQDFIAQMSGNDIAIVPLRSFKANTTYAIALTSDIKDTTGNSLAPSSSWASVQIDLETAPIVDPALAASELNETQAGIRLLQTLVNNYEDTIAELGADKDKVIYTQVMTTQSAGVPGTDPLQITKLLNAQAAAAAAAEATAAGNPLAAATVITQQTTSVDHDANDTTPNVDVALTVDMVLAAGGQELDATSTAMFKSAKYYGATIQVPYYLDAANPLTGRWEAACDSVIAMAGASEADIAAAAANPGANHALCSMIPNPVTGAFTDLGIDTDRHLTKYNPLPAATNPAMDVPVQITIPDVTQANGFRALAGLEGDIAKPATGWPVVILQHGITSKKEDMLAVTGMLAINGFASVAIDHPLHGARKIVLGEGDDQVVISATETDPTHYLNLSSLLTARDNLRQSVADGLKLRLSINGMVDLTNPAAPDLAPFDKSKVYYVGHSLGAITGTSMTAIANTPVTADMVADSSIEDEAVRAATADATAAALNASYKINATVLSNPGSSIANFLLESGAFSPLIKSMVTYGLGNELSALIAANIADIQTVIGTNVMSDSPSPYCQALAAGSTSQSDALVCAYDEFYRTADAAQMAGVQGGLAQFAFAAQAAIQAGDPSSYTSLLAATMTPTMVFETVGDGELNPSDTVIPNSVSTDPLMQISGTEGLANQMGLTAITGSNMVETGLSGIARFKFGSHGSLLTPDAGALKDVGMYATLFGAVTQEHQSMLVSFFASNGTAVQVSDTALALCVLKDATCAE